MSKSTINWLIFVVLLITTLVFISATIYYIDGTDVGHHRALFSGCVAFVTTCGTLLAWAEATD